MSRISTPAAIEASPTGSQPLLEAVKKQFGLVPNLFGVVGNSPAALEGCLGLNGALGKGAIGANLAKPDEAEILANRRGTSGDAKAAVRFAAALTRARGRVGDSDVAAVRAAGFRDAHIVEIVLHVALKTLTNHVNDVAETAIDFPVAKPLAA